MIYEEPPEYVAAYSYGKYGCVRANEEVDFRLNVHARREDWCLVDFWLDVKIELSSLESHIEYPF